MSPARTIRAVLFDKDGTLVDLHAAWVAAGLSAAQRLCTHAGQPERFRSLVSGWGYDPDSGRLDPEGTWASGSTESLIHGWMRELALAPEETLVAALLDDMTREAGSRARPLADLGALFQGLRAQGLRLGVATMDLERGARAALSTLAVTDLVHFVCGCDSGHGEKPGPGMVIAFARSCGLDPGEVMVVGDTPHDMNMARAARAGRAVAVTSGAADAAQLAPLADHVIPDIGHLPALLP